MGTPRFAEFIGQAWNEHATDPATSFAKVKGAVDLLETNEQIAQLAQLAAHLCGGDHLGEWQQGLRFLEQLRALPLLIPGSESDRALHRLRLSLELASGQDVDLSRGDPSDRIRILAAGAASLALRDSVRADSLWSQACALAENSPEPSVDLAGDDPAFRALAVSGNNIAAGLEEKTDRSPADTELMLRAALSARKFWEIAGTWLEVGRAEYRLAFSYLQAKRFAEASRHAQLALEIARENSAPAVEFFFGFEAVARVEGARKNHAGYAHALGEMRRYLEAMPPDDQSWCRASLEALPVTIDA